MIMTQAGTFEELWSAIADIGRDPTTGGYRRFAWTEADLSMREWFSGECSARGLDLIEDRMGNQWAWWRTPIDRRPAESSPAPTWTACRTGAPSTGRSAWSVDCWRSTSSEPTATRRAARSPSLTS